MKLSEIYDSTSSNRLDPSVGDVHKDAVYIAKEKELQGAYIHICL